MQMWHIPTITLEQTENNKWCNRHVSIDKSVQLTISKTFFGCFRSLYATHTYINSLSSVPKQTICTLCISLLMSHQHLKMVGPSFVSYFGQHQSSLWCFFFFFFSCDFALQSTTAISLSFRKIQVALNLNPERLCGNDCTLTELYQIHRRHTIGPTSTLNNHPN